VLRKRKELTPVCVFAKQWRVGANRVEYISFAKAKPKGLKFTLVKPSLHKRGHLANKHIGVNVSTTKSKYS